MMPARTEGMEEGTELECQLRLDETGEETGGISPAAEEAAQPPALVLGDNEPGGTTLVDARNGFNELS
eukprot:6376768-Ditylum_brightwellii.AAC.1